MFNPLISLSFTIEFNNGTKMEQLQTKYIGVLTRKKSTGKTAYHISYPKESKDSFLGKELT